MLGKKNKLQKNTMQFNYLKSKGRQNSIALYKDVYVDGKTIKKSMKKITIKVSILVNYNVESRDNDKKEKHGEFLPLIHLYVIGNIQVYMHLNIIHF